MVTQSCPTLCDPINCSTPGSPVLHCLLEFAQSPAHWVDDAINHRILCHPLLLMPSIFTSIRVFSNELALHIRWPKYWSFSISPFDEYWELVSFRIHWFDLLESPWNSQESSPAQFESINSLALSLLYGPTLISVHDYWKNCNFDYTFAGKVMSLLSNMLSRFVWRRKWQSTLVFMPREFHGQRSLAGYSPQGCKKSDTTEWISTQVCLSFTSKEQKHLLISCLQSLSQWFWSPRK